MHLTLQDLSERRHTIEYEELCAADLTADAALVFSSSSTEERGQHPLWAEILASHPERCFAIDPESGTAAKGHKLVLQHNHLDRECSLRDDVEILALLNQPRTIIMDISGLSHQVWASILRAVVRTTLAPQLSIVYVEPASYRSHDTPATLGSFDLSVGFDGIRPLPGFARLVSRAQTKSRVFVPMLGFEGSRPRLAHVELDAGEVAPIVGLPGFKMEFPAVALACNYPYLDEFNGYKHLRYARSACPFDAYNTIVQLARDLAAEHLQIAPLGTKPHAVGAVLYALKEPAKAEIVYDHPVRRPNRTEGLGRTHVYDISAFIRNW